jgi:glycosyltransferase involved in cell wall biosynthesis
MLMPNKVLIITYYWPPSGGAGVQRWLKFVKYLRQYGWEPVIYTPLNPEFPAIDNSLLSEIPENIEVLRTPIWEPYQLYKRLIGTSPDKKVNASGFISENNKGGYLQKVSLWFRGNFFIPDARKFWIKPSIKFLTQWLSTNHIDVIVSTGPPHSMHIIGAGVKKNTGIPWLADFRDPWTNIDFYHELNLMGWADKIHHNQEMHVLKNADEVVVISKSMKTDFSDILQRKYSVITNGYDKSDIDGINILPDEKFTIAHIGSMPKSRNPINLWKALASLKETILGFNDDLVIKLAGTVDHEVIESITSSGLSNNLIRIEYKPHDQIIELQKQSRVLLLIINDTPNAKVILPGKLFEYIASGRPILCIGPNDGDAAEILRETASGYVTETNNLADMIEKLRLLYTAFLNNNDRTEAENIAKYSRENLTSELAHLLDRIKSENNPRIST